MKWVVFTLLFFFSCTGIASAQNSNSNQGAGAAMQQPSVPAFPQWLVVRVLQAAQPDLYSFTGMHLGQLIQGYRNGAVVITYICRDAADVCKGVYRVSAVAGGDVIVSIMDEL